MPDQIIPKEAAGTRSANAAAQIQREPTPAEKAIKFVKDDSLMDNTPASTIPKDVVKIEPHLEPQRTQEPEHVDTPKSNVKKENKPETAKAEPTGKEGTKSVIESKKDNPATVIPPDKGASTVQPIVPKGIDKKEFDYTGFSGDEQVILKNMSVQSREHVIKLMKENKELSKNKDASFLQHPSAYTLDPQYTTLQDDVKYADKEAEYWQEQLTRIKNGDTWKPIKGFKTINGREVIETGDERPATHQAEEQARLMMNRCLLHSENKQQEIKQFTGKYKERLTSDNKAIQAERELRFGWVKNPEILKGQVEIEPGLIKTVQEIREDIISLFPPYMRNQIAVEVAADLFASLQIYGQELREAKANKQIEQVKEDEVTRAEPTSKTGGGSEETIKNGRVAKFTLAGLPT